MKTTRTMTDKAKAASQNNGKQSGGPLNPSNGNQSARKHGLLSRRLVFRSEEEKQEYSALWNDLIDECQPVGRTEEILVEEKAICFWKQAESDGWLAQEFAQRREAPGAILKTLADNYEGEQLPLFTRRDGSNSAVQFGWDCRELIIRTGTMDSEHEDEKDRYGERKGKGKSGHVQIEARLNTSLETILRYQAAIKRDLYRCIDKLRDLQRERLGKSVAGRDE
jgi:hypothetical protein